MRAICCGLAGLLLVVSQALPGWAQEVPLVAESEPLSPQEQQQRFHLPAGFVIELVAAEPEIPKPMNLNFDAAGQLYVTQSIEYPFPVENDQTGRDTIRLLRDTTGDGQLDSVSVYAEGLNIPIGVTPVPGGVLAYSIPQLSFFPSAGNPPQALKREPYYSTWGHHDTHGMCSSLTYWLDGWVYGCHGFSNDSTIRGREGDPVRMQSGNTYRLRPDGTQIEAFTRGQVNPFGLCFDPWGNVYTADCHSRPAYMLLRGAYYPSFGKPHDGLGFGPEIMQHAHGSTGISGVVYYEADQFPEEYQGNLFLGNPVTGRINRDQLAWQGATPTAIEQPDFLRCDDPWFRPVDLQLGPDGSLYVADFYNRIIGHYEVPLTHPGRDRERGRIWRIRYVGTDDVPTQSTPAPPLAAADADELIAALAHPNLWVRTQATHQLADRLSAEAAVSAVDALWDTPQASPQQLAHGLWVWQRHGATEKVAAATTHTEPLVRAFALRVAGEAGRARFSQFEEAVRRGFRDADPRVQLAAVQTAARHPQAGWEAELIRLIQQTDSADAMLIHAARMALRDHLAEFRNYEIDPQTAEVTAEILAERLADVALGIWAEHAAQFVRPFLNATPPDWIMTRLDPFVHHALRHLPEAEHHELLRELSAQSDWSIDRQSIALRACDRARQERGLPRPETLTAWSDRLAAARQEQQQFPAMLELIRDFGLQQRAEAAREIALNEKADAGVRKLTLETLASTRVDWAVECGQVWLSPPRVSAELQEHAATVLGRLPQGLGGPPLLTLLQTAPEATARSIGRGLGLSRGGAASLLEAMEKGTVDPRLLHDNSILRRLQVAQLEHFEKRKEDLLRGLPPNDERIARLIASRRAGFASAEIDLTRGHELFKKHCANCHRLGNAGNKVGPELDGIGQRGLDRLLEDTLDPNRVVDQAFRATIIQTVDGRVLNGLVLREEGAVVVLADEQGRETRVPVAEIEERSTLPLSPMPANVAENLTESDLHHLIGFLLSKKGKG